MSDRIWKLLRAIFVIVASQAVMFVGMMVGDGAMITMIAMVSGLVGIAVGIVLGVAAMLTSGTARYQD